MFRQFRAAKYEIKLEAGEKGLNLPPYKGSTLRGGFGSVFRRIACAQRNSECSSCLLEPNCPYAYIFETSPPPDAEVLKNYEAVAKPFVLEPSLDTRTFYQPGEILYFQLVLLGRAINLLPYFIVVLRELGDTGIGKGRKPYHLLEISALNDLTGARAVIYSRDNELVYNQDLSMWGADVYDQARDYDRESGRVTVDFQTMTRLKFKGHYMGQVPFHVLVRNLLRRLSSLYYFHHAIKPEGDFQSIIQRAEMISTVASETRWVDWERYSSRQDTRMKLGGVVGKVTYAGDMEEFWPLLTLGQWAHVGKGVTFGMGKYVLQT